MPPPPLLLFERLPAAVLRHVARFLGPRDVRALAATCRRLHSVLAPAPPSPTTPPPPVAFSVPLRPRIPTAPSASTTTSKSPAPLKRPSLFDDDEEEEEEEEEEGPAERRAGHSRASSTSSSFDEWFRRAVERGEARRSLALSRDSTPGSPVSPSPAEAHEASEQEAPPRRSGPPFRVLVARPECKALRHMLATFVRRFARSTHGDVALQQRALRALFADAEHAMRACVLWRGASPATFAAAAAGMRDHVFEQVFAAVYVRREHQARDAALARHYARLRRVVTPAFLEMPPCATATPAATAALARAAAELRRIDSVRAPAAKLACISACARTIAAVLGAGGAAAGADDFLPVLIHVVLDAQLLHVESDLQYIAAFADPDARYGEAYCYYTHLVSATAFLATLDPQTVVDTLAARARAAAAQHAAQHAADARSSLLLLTSGTSNGSGSTEEVVVEDGELVRTEAERAFVQRLHFLYSSVATLSDPEDVQLLRDEYARLARVCARHLPRHTGAQPWPKPPRVAPHAVVFPAGAAATAVCAHRGYAWVGFRSGRVAVYSLARAAVVCTLALFRAPVARICPVGARLWCVSAAGVARPVDPASYAPLPACIVLHAPAPVPAAPPASPPAAAASPAASSSLSSSSRRLLWLPFLAGQSTEAPAAPEAARAQAVPAQAQPRVHVRDVVYSAADDTGWSAATLTAPSSSGGSSSGGSDSSGAQTELCMFASTAPHVRACVRVDGAVCQLCLRGARLVALLDDGRVRVLDPATGDVLATCTLASPAPAPVPAPTPAACGSCRLCWSSAAGGDALWLADGGALQCAVGADNDVFARVRASPASLGSAALVASPAPVGGTLPQCEAVVAVDARGRVVVWNAATRTPAAVLGAGPAAPDGLACAPHPGAPGSLAVLVVKGNCLHAWVVEACAPSPAPPRRQT